MSRRNEGFEEAVLQLDDFIMEEDNRDADYTRIEKFLNSLYPENHSYDAIDPLLTLLDREKGNSQKYKALIHELAEIKREEGSISANRYVGARNIGYKKHIKLFPYQPTVDKRLADNGRIGEEEIQPAMNRYHAVHEPL